VNEGPVCIVRVGGCGRVSLIYSHRAGLNQVCSLPCPLIRGPQGWEAGEKWTLTCLRVCATPTASEAVRAWAGQETHVGLPAPHTHMAFRCSSAIWLNHPCTMNANRTCMCGRPDMHSPCWLCRVEIGRTGQAVCEQKDAPRRCLSEHLEMCDPRHPSLGSRPAQAARSRTRTWAQRAPCCTQR
jgi:hypothetical protein